MITVLQVLTDTNIGGAGIYLLNYLAARDRETFDVAVVLPKNAALSPLAAERGARVIEAETIADRSFSTESVRELTDLFKRERPALIHTHASLSARIAAKRLGIPVVHTRHCLEEPHRFPKNLLYRFINNRLSDRVIAVSHAVEENLLQDGIARKKLRMIYNGIPPQPQYSDAERSAFRAEFGIAPNTIAVGIVARLEEVKNHELFLQAAEIAAQKQERLVFLIVGEGSLESTLREKAAALSADIRFVGYQTEVARVFAALDIAVLCSHREALSLSLLEAMAQERAVVSTRSGGPEELIQDGENGLLCENHDPDALAAAILSLAEDENRRQTMGKFGKRFVDEHFAVADMAKKIEAEYALLAKETKQSTECRQSVDKE